MKKFFSGLALLTAVIALASCEDDIFGWGNGSHRTKFGENEVAFTIGGKKGTDTRADKVRTIVAPTNVIDLPREEGEPQLCLIETVTDMDENFYDAIGATRGTPIYTENFDDNYSDQLYVTAFVPKGNPSSGIDDDPDVIKKTAYTTSEVWGSGLGNNGTVQYQPAKDENNNPIPNTYSFDYSKGQPYNLPWPEGGDDAELWFFLQAPTMPSGVQGLTYFNDGSFEFNYTSPATADTQKDLLFGSRTIKKKDNEPDHDAHEVLLYHALTGVKFKVGNSEVLNSLDIQFTGVTMNLVGKGHCTVTPNFDYNATDWGASNKIHANKSNQDTKSSVCTTWSLTELNTTAYTVDFSSLNGKTAGTTSSDTYTPADGYFPESFYRQTTGAGVTVADHNLNDATYSKTFLVIPQTVSETDESGIITNPTYISVSYTLNGKAKSKQIVLPTAEWKAGELRTYTLDALLVDVDVTDATTGTGVEGDVKDQLETRNTGTSPEYLRVMLTANWVYNDPTYGDVIVATYPIVATGKTSDSKGYVNVTGFTSVDDKGNVVENFPGKDWLLGSDGFFYYRYAIQPGATPNTPLFTSFTCQEQPEDAHLEMSICVQAVKYDYEKKTLMSYWDMSAMSGVKVQTLGNADPLGHRERSETSASPYMYNELISAVEVPNP